MLSISQWSLTGIILDSWWKWLDSNMELDLDMIVYLRTTPEVAYQRMRARGRWEEGQAPFSYLQALHKVSKSICYPLQRI